MHRNGAAMLTGSEYWRSMSGVCARPVVSDIMLTRRPSFSNWSIDSWRTRPRSCPVTSCATTTARW